MLRIGLDESNKQHSMNEKKKSQWNKSVYQIGLEELDKMHTMNDTFTDT